MVGSAQPMRTGARRLQEKWTELKEHIFLTKRLVIFNLTAGLYYISHGTK
jgi:hypothetical protein